MENTDFILKLRKEFEKETGMNWQNSQQEPDIEYVEWLENKLKNLFLNIKLFIVE
jgi:hypothetical protein